MEEIIQEQSSIEKKKQPIWFKGGLIGFIIGLVGAIGSFPGLGFGKYILFPNIFLVSFFVNKNSTSMFEAWGMSIYTAPITYLIIGILIGLLYQKIKNN